MLNNQQYTELFLGSLFFLLLLGYLRNFILDNKYSTYNIVITSILFFLWFFSLKLLTNYT
jgi:hypothetical protein